MSKALKMWISCLSRQNTTHVTLFKQHKTKTNKQTNKQKRVHVTF